MKTILALALTLFAATVSAQTIGELCSSQYESADEGFEKTFCNRTPEQMRRQLNKLFSANQMLFHPNRVALTPRDQSNPRWVEFPPAPEGWMLHLTGIGGANAGYIRDPADVRLGEVTGMYMTLQARHYDGSNPVFRYRFGVGAWRFPIVAVKRYEPALAKRRVPLAVAPCMRLMEDRFDFSWTVDGACPEGYEFPDPLVA